MFQRGGGDLGVEVSGIVEEHFELVVRTEKQKTNIVIRVWLPVREDLKVVVPWRRSEGDVAVIWDRRGDNCIDVTTSAGHCDAKFVANAGLKIIFTGGPARSLPIEGNVIFQFVYFGIVVALSIVGVLIIKKLAGKYSKYILGA